MNSEKTGDLRCSKAAFKTVKGFTLIEMLIVIAIIGILAGITSNAIMGYIRNANLETANNKAQQVYTAVQNVMIQLELDQEIECIDADYINTPTNAADTKYAILQFDMYNGTIDGAKIVLEDDDSHVASYSGFTYPSQISATPTKQEKAFRKLAKLLTDNLSSDFTGYAYVSIDVENYAVDAVVYAEDATQGRAAVDATSGYTDEFAKIGELATKKQMGCRNVFDQKSDNKLTGHFIGFYPMMDDVSTIFARKEDRNPS